MIKYHDNNGNKRFETVPGGHEYANNWNPDIPYDENEYVNVHFRIECPSFSGMYGNFKNEADNKAFTEEKLRIFRSIGWDVEKPEFAGCCMEVVKGKARLYLHPQDFSGNVLKREVKQIAEALENNETFTICWVDIYETVIDVSDSTYLAYLQGKEKEIRKLIFENAKTKRHYLYKTIWDICDKIGSKVMKPRIGCRSIYQCDELTRKFVNGVVNQMTAEGYLYQVEDKNQIYVRSLNKTELKKAKLKEVS